MIVPPATFLNREDTHRLIPFRYSEGGQSVLSRLADTDEELSDLFELEGATNDRLLGESGLLPGITQLELVSGIPYAHIVNACFTHARPDGARFNGPDRGAWYAAFELETSEAEVAYHRMRELQEVNWSEEELSPYVDYLADFKFVFHDIRNQAAFSDCLAPDSYSQSQALGRSLLLSGSAGIIYPSVRRDGGTCLACFRPPLVTNPRKGALVTLTFKNAHSRPVVTHS
ncbi:MAG TPA: RES family NAD+ phosphorylase [Candidatus Angelobacter sp.]|nr:RES family NAD+ phosphorylase [Candidatus Angelobacter sp.]